jgi:hypothetical protein
VASLLEVAKESLEKVVKRLVPLENEREKLLTEKAFYEKVITEGKGVFPDIGKKIRIESILQQYSSRQTITELAPDRAGAQARKPASALSAQLQKLFASAKGEPLHVAEIAEKLVRQGFYPDKQRAIFRVENYFTKNRDNFVKVAPRTFQPRTEIGTIGEAIAAKGGSGGGAGHSHRGHSINLPTIGLVSSEEAASSEPAE